MVLTFVLWTIIFVLQKPVFLLLYSHLSQLLPVAWHGLQLDLAMAGYLTALPAVCLLLGDILRYAHKGPFLTPQGRKLTSLLASIYFWLTGVMVSLSFVANLGLYAYWQFPLDATPVFFITSSPLDALASVEWWQGLMGVVATALLAWAIEKIFMACYTKMLFQAQPRRAAGRASASLLVAEVLLVALLFLPIRGGVTVSTVNTGWAYFSQNQTLNHAAVNPLFSFLESISHQENFDEQYRYMDDHRAHQLVAELNRPVSAPEQRAQWLSTQRPDIYLLIMESFSDTVCNYKSKDLHSILSEVTPRLNGLRRQGLYFSRFYANSYRTDRGLVSILQGYPSPPTVSLMKYPKKTEKIASLPKHLKAAGYGTRRLDLKRASQKRV